MPRADAMHPRHGHWQACNVLAVEADDPASAGYQNASAASWGGNVL